MTTLQTVTGGAGVPIEPDWTAIYTDELDVAAAKTYWREVVNEMRESTTLAVANGHAILRLVQFRLEYDRSARAVHEEGKIIRAKRTKSPQISPQWTCMRQAAEAVVLLEAELGLSPRRRNSVGKVQRGKKQTTAADGYLRSVKRPDDKVGSGRS